MRRCNYLPVFANVSRDAEPREVIKLPSYEAQQLKITVVKYNIDTNGVSQYITKAPANQLKPFRSVITFTIIWIITEMLDLTALVYTVHRLNCQQGLFWSEIQRYLNLISV